jgi:endo-1,4-beta-mannosidase
MICVISEEKTEKSKIKAIVSFTFDTDFTVELETFTDKVKNDIKGLKFDIEELESRNVIIKFSRSLTNGEKVLIENAPFVRAVTWKKVSAND